jgi:nitrate/nitrite transporter NarK
LALTTYQNELKLNQSEQRWSGRTTIAIAATMGGQGLGAAAQLSPAILAVQIAAEADLSPSLVGVYTGLVFFAAAISALGGGGLVGRYGGITAVRIGVGISCVGCVLAAIGHPVALVASALAIGLGYGPMTPASSVILSRWSPENRLGLIMSIKQTGVPIGYFLASLTMPALQSTIGWQASLLCLAGVCFVALLAMRQAARLLDEPGPSIGSGFTSARLSLGLLKQNPYLRKIALASLAFAGVQVAVTSFLVVYLEDSIGLSKQLAALPLAVAGITAIFGRIAWGWLADTTSTARLLTVLPVLMAGALCVLLAADANWDVLLLGGLGVVLGLSVLAWNGVMLYETARRAPPGQVGLATSGVLALTFFGSTVFPQTLSIIVSGTGSYQVGFIAMTCVCIVVTMAYFRDAVTKK